MNHSQFTPYVSVETALNQDLYELVKVIFGDLFQWIQKNVHRIVISFSSTNSFTVQLQELLPKEYDLLEASACILPGNHHSPVLPFLSLVFNLNVTPKDIETVMTNTFALSFP
ncbi:uncharacterized protein BJ212DRAFT_1268802 [Suillus subaureus]|uniref:Uncharacterized protein n=1 Tax=Suillus subaureus TaxID=48587 RepID=A0A9P7JF37_9AGAM|nr:uncharacterized protein BJ212DRAFT_1268802 [Suillus subaureus]KAG1818569.1 hypothetical protein BJ212DRAFT_1268802 [Suillus subaureus]